ncbi:hypothetical protein L7F22_000253 [Adiantum nelumboides]|nr:hypothetical protein [Adiantum nelumboides]
MCKNMIDRGKAALGAKDQQTGMPSYHQNGNDQSVADRRLLRAQYRAVKMDIAERKLDADGFDHIFGNVEHLYNEVSRPREQIADAEALYEITASILASVKDFKCRRGPTAAELVSSIARNFGTDVVRAVDGNETVIDWERLGCEACAVFSDAPGLTTMMGPMDSQQKQRKTPVRRPRDRLAATARPEELRDSTDNETLTDKNMETMFKILKQLRLAYLEELVLNRQSFAQTVENIFALSFLVKDGRAEIFIRDGRQIVGPKNFPSQHQRELGKGSMSQFVFRFDFKDWQGMKGMVEEGQELMPHREGYNAGLSARVKRE